MGADGADLGIVGRRLGLVVLIAAVGIGLALPSSASVIEKISLKSLQEDAEVIAIARVVSSKSVTQAGTIQTKTVLAIERSWRGPKKGQHLLKIAILCSYN